MSDTPTRRRVTVERIERIERQLDRIEHKLDRILGTTELPQVHHDAERGTFSPGSGWMDTQPSAPSEPASREHVQRQLAEMRTTLRRRKDIDG